MITSANTSINKNKVHKLYTLIADEGVWEKGFLNLDVGGGKYDTATEFLAKRGVTNLIYDPYNRTKEHNKKVLAEVKIHRPDTATLSNVLNVIQKREDRIAVLKFVRNNIKHYGRVFITCYNSGKHGVSKKGCWQNAWPLSKYAEELQEVFYDVRVLKGFIVAWSINRRNA